MAKRLETVDIDVPPNTQAVTVKTDGAMTYAMGSEDGPAVGLQFLCGEVTTPIYSVPAGIMLALADELKRKALAAKEIVNAARN